MKKISRLDPWFASSHRSRGYVNTAGNLEILTQLVPFMISWPSHMSLGYVKLLRCATDCGRCVRLVLVACVSIDVMRRIRQKEEQNGWFCLLSFAPNIWNTEQLAVRTHRGSVTFVSVLICIASPQFVTSFLQCTESMLALGDEYFGSSFLVGGKLVLIKLGLSCFGLASE